MKKTIAIAASLLTLALPFASYAADHSGHGNHNKGVAHEEVIDGIKATFTIQTMADAMKSMGMAMPKGVKETHHISVSFKDTKNGKGLSEGAVAIKIQNPDKSTQSKELSGMDGHFGGDFIMGTKGKYGIMSKFQLKDGKTGQAKFWYTVK
jgi:hypothetical protein